MPYQQIGSDMSGASNVGGGLFQNAGSVSGLANNYAATYNNALSLNLQKYSDTMKGYQTGLTNMQNAQQGITNQYGDLRNNVMGLLGFGQGGALGAGGAVDWSKVDLSKGAAGVADNSFGIGTGAARGIANTLVANRGAVTNQMIASGLGNSTTLANNQNQQVFQAQEAVGQLGNALAQTGAGYESQLGQAKLNYENQANMQNAAWQGDQLHTMANTSIPYPNTQAYGSLIGALLARQYGGANNHQAAVNPFGSGRSSQGHIPFSAGQSMPSPPAAQQGQGGMGYRPPPISQQIQMGLNGGANTVGYGTLSQADISELSANGYSEADIQAIQDAQGGQQEMLDAGYNADDLAAIYSAGGGE